MVLLDVVVAVVLQQRFSFGVFCLSECRAAAWVRGRFRVGAASLVMFSSCCCRCRLCSCSIVSLVDFRVGVVADLH
jgi:hypothetical protein